MLTRISRPSMHPKSCFDYDLSDQTSVRWGYLLREVYISTGMQ